MAKRNIILITVDSLCADHLGCYGYPESISPNIDNLARESILFTQAIANGPYTIVSVPSFLTSRYVPSIDNLTPVIAQILKKEGYNTAAFNPNVRLFSKMCRPFKLTRGFDVFDLLLTDKLVKEGNYFREAMYFAKRLQKRKWLYSLIKNLVINAPFPLTAPIPRAKDINKRAITWLKKRDRSPFFLWLFYMDVHMPYLPIDKLSSSIKRIKAIRMNRKLRYFKESVTKNELETLHNLYLGEIEYLDRMIQSFVDNLKNVGLYDNTVIIFTADHGEQFREHGKVGHPDDFYEELLHVPLLIHGAGIKKKLVECQVSLLDLAPTIADIAGTQCENFYGQSLISHNYEERGVLSLAGFQGDHYCYRTHEWKFIANENDQKYELYNLREDPDETRNVFEGNKSLANQLRNRALELLMNDIAFRHDHEGFDDEIDSDTEKAIEDRLRALGYLD